MGKNYFQREIEVDEEAYDEMLDDVYGKFEIGYAEFYASTILKECDPIAYNMGKQDYADGLDQEWECEHCGSVYSEEDEARECCSDQDEEEDLAKDAPDLTQGDIDLGELEIPE